MGDVVKFESESPSSWTVEDALERALEVVRNGEYPADRVYVALCRSHEPGEKHGSVFYTMAGMQLPEAIGWLRLHEIAMIQQED